MTPNEWDVVAHLYDAGRPSDYPADLQAALDLLHNRLPQDAIDDYVNRWHEPSDKLQGVLRLIDTYRSASDEQIEEWLKPPDPSEMIELSEFIEETRQMLKERSHVI